MNTKSLRLSAVAVAMVAVCGAASAAALPQFTLNPGAAGLKGDTVTADNILVSDYSTVNMSGKSFTESGYLDVSGYELGGSVLPQDGLNSTYSVFIKFNGTGTLSQTGNPATTANFGSFDSLNYTLYGYNGAASFGFDSSNAPTTTATGATVLATGSLLNGSVLTVPSGDGKTFVPGATASLSFNVNPAETGFFQSPSPFYNVALTSFINTASEVQAFDGGFMIRQGGGSVNFVAAVPEPETYAMMLAGLGVMGFLAKRRKAA